ncbi:MAG: hypothetical protein R3199_12645, partial [Gemmatimonadota bacterium]|nr:hypothetical protein [Gemmatimonadota bacterium]
AFELAPDRIGRVYAANLAGSGLGALAGLAAVAFVPAGRVPAAVALIGGLAAIFLLRRGWLIPLALAGWLALGPEAPIPVSDYKEGSQALRLPDAEVIDRRDGPLGRLELIGAPSLRYLPGLSLAQQEPVPSRPVLYLNRQPLGPRVEAADTTLLGRTPSAAANALRPGGGPALVLGLGGGEGVWLARAGGATDLAAVDPDGRIDALLGPSTLGPAVRREILHPRAFLRASGERFDRILVTETGSLAGGAAGMAAAGSGWLFTREAIADMWRDLDDDGILTITRWALDPPRDALRLLATFRSVLESEGARAADHVAMVRGWSTVALLLSRRPIAPEEVDSLLAWAESQWFDVPWAPGAPAEAANRYHRLDPDWYRIGAERLLGPDPERFVEAYPFRIDPVTDSAPFFFHFLPFSEIPDLWESGGRLALAWFEWGIVTQVLVLVQAVPLAAALILLPLLFLPGARRGRARGGASGWEIFGYFALLGLGFLLLEISAIQRLVLFLAHPVVATATVLGTFLVFAGLGSASARRLAGRAEWWLPFAAIALVTPASWLAQFPLWQHAAGWSLVARVAVSVALLAPVAFFLGMPFPLGLARISETRPSWVPWCWGVNGFLSVVAAATAPLLALAVGFRGVLSVSIVLYGAAAALFARLRGGSDGGLRSASPPI